MEGIIEISLGLFLAGSIGIIFGMFPQSIIGAMLLFVAYELGKFAGQSKLNEIPLVLFTAGVSVATNMAIGFVAAIIVYHAYRWGRKRYDRAHGKTERN